jgi:carbon starvation protein
MELVVIMCGVIVLFLAAYRIVGRYLERQLEVDDSRVTPATSKNDGMDYVPTKPAILFGHHFSSIAGAGPIVGPILAGLAFGWGPALLWIVLGAALVGGVHDFSSLMASLRHEGQSVGQVCKRYLSPLSYYLMLTFIWVAMIYVLIVFLDLTATSFAPAAAAAQEQGGAVATASMFYIALAVVFGFLVYRWNVPLSWASAVFVPLVFLAVWAGILMPWTAERVPALFGSAKNTWCAVLLAYCFLASILPVWVMLQPRDYLSAYLLVTCLVGGVAGVVASGLAGRLDVQYPVYIGFKDASLGYLYPAMFITIACGAMSGFHSIVASGTTSKQIACERDARPVAYGGMLTEGVLAVVALASVMVLAGKPAGLSPTMVFGNGIGTFVGVFGIDPKVGATFGVLAVSTFLLTTLDTCTRLGRFILQELTGLSGAAGRFVATAATLAIPAVLVFVQVKGEPAWRVVWPAFGATNQLLGALALLAVFAWLKHHGRRTVYVFVPMVFMAVTTMAALIQLISQKFAGNVTALDMFVGVVSLMLALLAVVLFGNTFWRLYRNRPIIGKI